MNFRALPKQVNHTCFACGSGNPMGLHMTFETDEESLRSRFEVPKHMAGWSTVVHGGIVATILDEVMSNGAIYLIERIILTRSMQIELLRPVLVEQPVIARGWLVEQPHERKALMGAELLDAKGQICARATGDYALFTPEQFRKRGLDEGIVKDFESWMAQCGKTV